MNLSKLLAQGGPAMWPLYLCSVLAFAVFAQRLWFYRKIRGATLPWLSALLQRMGAGHYEHVSQHANSIDHPVARVVHACAQLGQTRPDRVEAEAQRVGTQEIERYEQHLPLLALITQIAPLLGLLGTVIGMVQMFFGLQGKGLGNVDAAALSAGIWQALLTTAAGLVVAAPTMAAHYFLVGRLRRLKLQMNDAVIQMLHVLPHLPEQVWSPQPLPNSHSDLPAFRDLSSLSRKNED
ncbi:MAG: MotA/TolQ/ExbB proton channel family protein [Myxococcota bacterium]